MTGPAAGLPKVLIVTGTDTGVGKTVTTAALAAVLGGRRPARARQVAVYKPTQTGVLPGEAGDIGVVTALTGVRSVSEGVRLPDPMAPVAAADRAGVALPGLDRHLARVRQSARGHDHVLVEGAGGVLVRLDRAGRTLADLAAALGPDAAVVVVCRSGLGALNHTELTLEALRRRQLRIAGLVIGSWPARPDGVDLSNRDYLAAMDVPLIGRIPEGAGLLGPGAFVDEAPGWFQSGLLE